jgi:superfamily I DNA and RNA helicase
MKPSEEELFAKRINEDKELLKEKNAELSHTGSTSSYIYEGLRKEIEDKYAEIESLENIFAQRVRNRQTFESFMQREAEIRRQIEAIRIPDDLSSGPVGEDSS